MINKNNIIRVWKWADYEQKRRLEKDFPWITKEGWALDINDIDEDDMTFEDPESEERILSIQDQQIEMAIQRRTDQYKDGE